MAAVQLNSRNVSVFSFHSFKSSSSILKNDAWKDVSIRLSEHSSSNNTVEWNPAATKTDYIWLPSISMTESILPGRKSTVTEEILSIELWKRGNENTCDWRVIASMPYVSVLLSILPPSPASFTQLSLSRRILPYESGPVSMVAFVSIFIQLQCGKDCEIRSCTVSSLWKSGHWSKGPRAEAKAALVGTSWLLL